MNLGPLVRGVMGDKRAGEPKTLELRTGQVVRGTVLSVSEDGQEAVIRVQGVKLHAALETPLRPGETTLLQVQPQSKDGLTVLKPMAQSANVPLSAASMAKALEAVGLEDTPANRELLQLMRNSGIPLSKENAAVLLKVSLQKPPSVLMSEWIQSASVALNRGLPLTGESVGGLHQAIFGPPLHSLLSTLEEQLGQLTKDLANNGGNKESARGSNVQQTPSGGTASGMASSPASGQSSLSTAISTSPAGPSVQGQMHTGQAGVSSGIGQHPNGTKAELSTTRVSSSGSLSGAAGNSMTSAAVQATADDAPQLLVKLQQVLTELRGIMAQGAGSLEAPESLSKGLAAGGGTAPAGTAATAPEAAAAGKPAATALAAAAALGEGPAGPSPGTRPTPTAELWVGRVLKLLGAEHEQQALRAAAAAPAAAADEAPPAAGASPQRAGAAQAPGGATGSVPQAAPGMPPASPLVRSDAAGVPLAGGAGMPAGQADKAALPNAAALGQPVQAAPPEAVSAHDTLKSVLLQVQQSDEFPASIQETTRQLVAQLTGQQLLLNTDRTAPFAQVTMFLPFYGPDGKQTASVHIESRRGRKGELDPSNCRLWFDLQMRALGQIMVDVQVADRKVILKLYSEQEITGAFLESRQDEVAEALKAAGYTLLSMRSDLIIPAEQEEGSEEGFRIPVSYAPTPYKGVDYRI